MADTDAVSIWALIRVLARRWLGFGTSIELDEATLEVARHLYWRYKSGISAAATLKRD